MNILELFSGTHSIGKVFAGENIISVDLDSKFNPTHLVDILTFDYKQYPADYFNYIHASPPCILYSQSQLSWYNRNKRHNITGEMVLWTKELHQECITESDKLVLKVLEILEYFKPKYWTIENPYHHNWCCIHKRPLRLARPCTIRKRLSPYRQVLMLLKANPLFVLQIYQYSRNLHWKRLVTLYIHS